MKKFTGLFLTLALLLAASTSFATTTVGVSVQAKNDMLTAAYITGSPVIKFALGLSSANTSVGPTTTNYSSFTDLGTVTATGYTTGGATVSGLTVVSTPSATGGPAADLSFSNIVWTLPSSGATSLAADVGCLYNSTSGHIIAIYALSGTIGTNVTASGNSATFTVSAPTVATGTRGAVYGQ